MPTEIERKFLVSSDLWRLSADGGRRMRQAIIFSNGDRSLRIRAVDRGKAQMTLKIGVSDMTRHEFEYDVPMADAEELLDLADGSTLTKTRYEVVHAGHVWEVDVYEGDLTGLVVAEVEIDDERVEPELPPWVGREVTGDRRYSNQALAESGIGENWRDGF